MYSAFLTVVCLACPAVIIWLDPWRWEWPNIAFLVSGNTAAATFVWFVGPLFWPYFLLQMGVGYFRVYAMASGLIGSRKSRSWKVCTRARGVEREARVGRVRACVVGRAVGGCARYAPRRCDPTP